MKYAIAIIASFVRNVHLKRALKAVEPDPHMNFWRVISGSTLDIAVIEWCKLFGSDDEERQPVHWKNQVPAERHDEFRAGLYAALGLSADEWKAYWRKVKEYRDNQAAHFNEEYLRPENDPTYPDLTVGLEAAYFYYGWLIAMMDAQGIAHRYPVDIRDYCQRFADQAENVARLAVTATASVEEKVL